MQRDYYVLTGKATGDIQYRLFHIISIMQEPTQVSSQSTLIIWTFCQSCPFMNKNDMLGFYPQNITLDEQSSDYFIENMVLLFESTSTSTPAAKT